MVLGFPGYCGIPAQHEHREGRAQEFDLFEDLKAMFIEKRHIENQQVPRFSANSRQRRLGRGCFSNEVAQALLNQQVFDPLAEDRVVVPLRSSDRISTCPPSNSVLS